MYILPSKPSCPSIRTEAYIVWFNAIDGLELKLNKLPKKALLLSVPGKINSLDDIPNTEPRSSDSIADTSQNNPPSSRISRSALLPKLSVALNITIILLLFHH